MPRATLTLPIASLFNIKPNNSQPQGNWRWNVKQLRKLSQMSLRTGKRIYRPVRAVLIGFLMTFVAAMSGCKSSSQIPSCPASQVVVDSSLMVAPTYQKTLLDSLSNKPSEQTLK